ncbi:MAG: M1 family metallopeptidase [Ferruginibacter sp.]
MQYLARIIIIMISLSQVTFIQRIQAQPFGEKKGYTHQDTLRGSDGRYRQQWDVLKYEIAVQPDFESKTLQASNIMTFYDNGAKCMQIDLQEPMILDSVVNEDGHYSFNREGNVYWVMFRDSNRMYKIIPGERTLRFYYHGKPKEAKRAPWDGGWIWKKDKEGNPWMSVACQGLGASVWYPCKDYQGDEPDSGAILHVTVPDSLVAVGNGRLVRTIKNGKGLATYTWQVHSPINNYNIVPYIGKYVHFSEVYPGLKGNLDMDYWVLDYNLEKAKTQFLDAPRMMKAFEYWFGPYPFYVDGYKLVEALHLGMEHQSNVAYGNGYQNGYAGRDLSGSGWGLKWDFIIVHESGHEWFANSITTKDIADMWVHEGFTNYSETLFTDFYYGHEAGNAYVIGTRKAIANDIPIIGPYGVNREGSGDMYYKAGNMLHIIRQMTGSDEKFRALLTGMNRDFYHSIVTSAQVEKYLIDKSGLDLSKIFDQYLRTTLVPELEYKLEGKRLYYRWNDVVPGFNMPIDIAPGKKNKATLLLKPTGQWKSVKVGKSYSIADLKANPNYYIHLKMSL